MCHMPFITYRMSRVACQVSRVTCHIPNIYKYIHFFLQVGGCTWLRVCFQRGLPRLVHTKKCRKWRYYLFDSLEPYNIFQILKTSLLPNR